MESRAWIREAQRLSRDVATVQAGVGEDDVVQRRVNQLFNQLDNPSLMAASELMKLCHQYHFLVPERAAVAIQFFDQELG